MTISIEYETEIQIEPAVDYETVIKAVIEEAVEFEQCPYETEVNVILTDNDAIRDINREYREIDTPTDVLSFPMITYDEPADFEMIEAAEIEDYFNPETGELVLGDIIISVEKVMAQAEEFGHSTKRELAFLVAHSMMHLFGYDHMTPEEAAVMEDKQNQVLININIPR